MQREQLEYVLQFVQLVGQGRQLALAWTYIPPGQTGKHWLER